MSGAFGKVFRKKDGYEVQFERALPYSAEVVWDMITNPTKLACWFTDIEMDFVPGGKMTFTFRDAQKTQSVGRILRIEPPKVFEYMWEEELATWEIFPQGKSACKLVLTYSKLPDEYAISVPAGWHILLDQLEEVLHGRTEQYPFGGEETEVSKTMKEAYASIITKNFPTLKTKK